MQNAIPSRGKTASPLQLAFKTKENFKNLATFGCRVWIKPPCPSGRRKKGKLHADSIKGIFLGFEDGTTRNIRWYDPATDRVKLAAHFRFDEMFHDLPHAQRPPNVIQLERCQGESGLPPFDPDDDTPWSSSSDLEFFTSSFPETITETIEISPKQITSTPNCFGFVFNTERLNQRCFVSEILRKSDASSLLTSKTAKASLLGAYVLAINDSPVFTQKDVTSTLSTLLEDSAVSFSITFGKQNAYTAQELDQTLIDLDLAVHPPSTSSPDVDLDEDHLPSLSLDDVRHITALLYDDITYKDLLDIPLSTLELAVNAIRSSDTTAAEQALGHFTRRKLKTLPNWSDWNDAEFRQLDRFRDLEMYGEPQFLPIDSKYVLLHPHW